MARELEYEIETDIDIKEPAMYKVLLLNDDYSTMDFVIDVLINIFRKSYEDATKIMLNIHNNGKDICGVYTHEIASTKIVQVTTKARKAGFPLKATMEEI